MGEDGSRYGNELTCELNLEVISGLKVIKEVVVLKVFD